MIHSHDARRKRLLRWCYIGLLVAVVEVASGRVYAQDEERVVELSAGYALLHTEANTLPAGIAVSVATPLKGALQVVGEVGAHFQTIADTFVNSGLNFSYSFLGGPRISVLVTPKVRLFGQVVLGTVHSGSHVRFNSNETLDVSVNRFVWQPGVGIDVFVASRLAVRFEGDYRVVRVPGIRRHVNHSRLVTSVVFHR